jgi:hypothetical protein
MSANPLMIGPLNLGPKDGLWDHVDKVKVRPMDLKFNQRLIKKKKSIRDHQSKILMWHNPVALMCHFAIYVA